MFTQWGHESIHTWTEAAEVARPSKLGHTYERESKWSSEATRYLNLEKSRVAACNPKH